MRFSLVILALVFAACNHVEKPKEEIKPVIETPFQKFVKRFKPTDLPFKYFDNSSTQIDVSLFEHIDMHSVDTVFYADWDMTGALCYYVLKDTAKFYSLIYLIPADRLFPVLVTYTKEGKVIGSTGLIARGCGGDCGLTYCSSSGIINSDLSIYCADTVKYKYECDSLGPIPNSGSTEILFKKGKITPNGIIVMEKEQQSKIKNNQ